jgi:DNA (cytosine-5)-methyltransferase 1
MLYTTEYVHSSDWRNVDKTIRVAELFAGVGGFRLGLEGYRSVKHPEFNMPSAGPYRVVWANQWEPPGNDAKQFAWRCYEARFGLGSCVNEDIHVVMNRVEKGEYTIPEAEMVVGGFPCQDYSVAHSLKSAAGIEGKKGVLWWEIVRFLKTQKPRYCLFENVDRLLKSPVQQRGRDFAIMLSCLMDLGYAVEWRVVNSAEYGFSQRRKRVYIYAERDAKWTSKGRLLNGVMASAFPIKLLSAVEKVSIPNDPYVITRDWNNYGISPFLESGIACHGFALTARIHENYKGVHHVLGNVVVSTKEVPREFWVPSSQLPKWEYLKGSKRERRKAANGHVYWYSEGSMAYPDLLTNPSRTILTSEGGNGASRFKHIIEQDGRMRRLIPDELDMLQGFPKGWTDVGMSDGKRAFCMGNALVVGIPHLIGQEIATRRYNE